MQHPVFFLSLVSYGKANEFLQKGKYYFVKYITNGKLHYFREIFSPLNYDHYLKGMPAPEWMVYGIPAVKKGKTDGYRLVPEENNK